MGFFDHLQKGGSHSLQSSKPQIRKVIQPRTATSSQVASATPEKLPVKLYPHSTPKRPSPHVLGDPPSASRQSLSGTASVRIRTRKTKTLEQRLSSGEDEDEGSRDNGADDTDSSFEVRKRARIGESAEPDPERRVRLVDAFAEGDASMFPMIHATDIAPGLKTKKFQHAFGKTGDPEYLLLQYPSAAQEEKYSLVVSGDRDGFKPIDDIVQVVEVISQYYIPEDQADEFSDNTDGIKRRLRRALARKSEREFRDAVSDYNRAVKRLLLDGSIAKRLDEITRLPLPAVERILTQIYSRTVSPRVESLRRYENGTDNVYGELLPRFISTVFKETQLKSRHIFVDLGSGVGNVVLQAALEIGCESWGCEIMENACSLAELQQTEFKARCRLWGLAAGETHLVRGDFLKEECISDVLKRADVVLINNQAFTPQLNNELVNHFLDLKEGCQIVSLKSFVPAGHKIQSRNLNSPVNLLRVERKDYWSNSVSWTDVGGTYFIATKDSSRLKAFVEQIK